MRCTASATSTLRIGCGRWNSSGASDSAGCRRSSARRPCRRIASCARSASAAPRRRRGRTRARGASGDRRVRRGRQRVHRHASRHAALPPEFTLLRFEPEPFDRRRRGGLAEDDGVGPERETTRSSCCGAISPPRSARSAMAELMPPYPIDGLEHSAVAGAADRRADSGERLRQPCTDVRRPRPAATRSGRSTSAWRHASARVRRSAVRRPSRRPRSASSAARDRIARIEQLGRRRHAARRAANRCSPTTRISSTQVAFDLVSRAHLGRRLRRSIGATLPGTPADRARPQSFHRLGRDQRRRRCRGSLSRTARSTPADSRSSAAGRSRCRSFLKRSASRARARVGSTCASSRHGPLVSDAINANNAASPAEPRTAAARTAGVPVDRARSDDDDDCRDDAD